MQKILSATMGLFLLSGLTLVSAQQLPPYQQQQAPNYPPQNYPPPSYPSQNYPPPAYSAPRPGQVTPQVLGDMLRTAATFNELVRSMNLNRSLGPDVHTVGPDGRVQHSVQRTAETIGAGAGAGAALGAMSRNPNGVMIGALIGGAGGLIVDQVLRHQEEVRERAAVYGPVPDGRYVDPARQFREREPERR